MYDLPSSFIGIYTELFNFWWSSSPVLCIHHSGVTPMSLFSNARFFVVSEAINSGMCKERKRQQSGIGKFSLHEWMVGLWSTHKIQPDVLVTFFNLTVVPYPKDNWHPSLADKVEHNQHQILHQFHEDQTMIWAQNLPLKLDCLNGLLQSSWVIVRPHYPMIAELWRVWVSNWVGEFNKIFDLVQVFWGTFAMDNRQSKTFLA